MATVRNLFAQTETVIVLTKNDIYIYPGSPFEKIPDFFAEPPKGQEKIMKSGTMFVKEKSGRCYMFFRNFSGNVLKPEVSPTLFDLVTTEAIKYGSHKLIN